MNPFKICYLHALLAVFAVIFLLLSGFSSAFIKIIARKKSMNDEILKPVMELRFKFDVAYFGIGTVLLLIAYILGTLKEGFGSAKAITTLFVLIYNFSVPAISGLFPKESKRELTEYLFIISGFLIFLNIFVGNLIFTGFHKFL